MNQLLSDLWAEMQGYYDNLVALLPKLILALLVFSFIYFLARRLRKTVARILIHRMDDPLLANFLARFIQSIIVVIDFLVFLSIVGLGKAAGSLLASAGVGAFIIGFAFKDIGENLLAGIMLAFKRPFKVGDLVEMGDVKGSVVSMTLRDTHVKTAEGIDVYIPNGNIIKNPLKNYTIDGDLRFDFTVGLDYGSDMDRAIELILGALKEVPGVMHQPRTPLVMVKDLGASTLNLTVYYWIDAFDPKVSGAVVKNKAVNEVLSVLGDAGYYLPSDILEIKNYHETDLKALTKSETNAPPEPETKQQA